jgi:transposase
MDNLVGIKEFKVLEKREKDNNVLFVVEPARQSSVCPHCFSKILNKHGKITRHARDLNYFDKLCELEIIGDRYRCENCGKTFVPSYKAVDERAKVTNRLKAKIQKETLKKPFAHLANEYALSKQTIKRFFEEYVYELERDMVIKAPVVIGIDEAHLNKQMRAVFTDIKERKILELLPARSKETILAFLESIPDNTTIKVGTIDMYRPYKEALIETGRHIVVVVDKFHVVHYAINAMEMVRKKLGENLPKEDRRYLLNTRYSLLKNKEDATEADQARIEALFHRYPEYATAYHLKESFRGIYKNKNKNDALQSFADWENSIPANMQHFREVAKTVNNWKEEIFNYFDHPYTNAFTESINNLIKEIEKRGRGYAFDVLRAKVLFGTPATKRAKYKRPEMEDFRMNLMSMTPYDAPVVESGFGVDMQELLDILNADEF